MWRKWSLAVVVSVGLGVGAASFAACDSGGDGVTGSGTSTGGSVATSTGGNLSVGSATAGAPGCQGLECDVPTCPSSKPDGTTISGIAYAPNGTLPLYNVIVYIPKFPDADLEPITLGAECEQCPATIANSVRVALTDPTGAFTLTDVPAGDNIPIVVQIGKWRRKVVLPKVEPCMDHPLTDPEQTRLPRSTAEGDIPQMSIVTGGCDPLPCLFRKMGLADTEYSNPAGSGRMHVYQGIGGVQVDGGGAPLPEQALWDSVANLSRYDITILSCECDEYNQTKTPAQKGFMRDYLNVGGRVFATHFHYTWFKNGPPEFAALANWTPSVDNNPYTIDTSFPKGAAFAQWMQTVSTTVVADQINLTSIRYDLSNVNPPAQRWIYKPSPESVKYFTFNTPIGTPPEEQCGRGVFSDIHVSEGGVPGGSVPAGCDNLPLTDQEKALIFLFFDLAACLTPDGEPPPVPNPE